MIRVSNLNKYFNKGKQNQIHVIDNTTLQFPEKGLVALTGPSGCGKTTLLNVIGGLDKFESGQIVFDNQVINRYKPLEWDILRNKYIGYIFQNYNLISDKTVYENIEIALNMAGLYDKEEIEERINYVLEAVGMYNYRRRSVLALSGGQQQRVAIARAIAKNPKVVLADEPTGNLDANNTFEIMSIIKKISQTCLVILVSHEKNIVDFYADRVIQLSDGKVISDEESNGNRSFDHVDERNIYLKDLNMDDSLKDSNVVRYYEEEKDDSLSFKVIEVKDSIYIKAESKSKKKIKFLTDDTEVKLIDDHYKARKTDDVIEYQFDLEQFKEIEHTKNKRSFIRMVDTLKSGFKKVTSKKKFIGRLFLLAYFVISALVVYQIATFANITRVDDEDFLRTAKDLISVSIDKPNQTVDVLEILNEVDGVEVSPFIEPARYYFTYKDYYQGDVSGYSGFNYDYLGGMMSIYPIGLSWADESTIVLGNLPESNTQIAIDLWIAESILETKAVSDIGLRDTEDLIGLYITSANNYNIRYEIVGIIETESPTAVVLDEALYGLISTDEIVKVNNFVSNKLVEGHYTIVDGVDVQDSDEVVLEKTYSTFVELGANHIIGGYTFTVVGFYEAKIIEDSNQFSSSWNNKAIVDESIIDEIVIEYLSSLSSSSIYLHSDNLEQAIQDIQDLSEDYEVINAYESQREYNITLQRAEVASKIQQIVITLGGIVIYIFFMMRSSMINRIREIGIYRSIGATKRDIFKIFIGEIFWFTTLGSFSGYMVMAILINRVQNTLGELVSMFYLPWYYLLGGIVGIYLINIIFGLLPIFNLLRKTPSEINAKFDI
jgi:ABC-type lipoprotein export system ATPase subunit